MPLETEAKFIVRDRVAFLSLLEMESLGGYLLKDKGSEEVRDTYLDTADGKYLQAGYACRLRRIDVEYFIALKSMVSSREDIHVRTELEERIDDPAIATRVERWPEGAARELATRIGRGMMLGALCEVRQQRWKRDVTGKPPGPPLFELSLDEVRVPGLLYCLEVELRQEAGIEELDGFVKLLRKVGPLETDRLSKLEHALRAAGIKIPPRDREVGRG